MSENTGRLFASAVLFVGSAAVLAGIAVGGWSTAAVVSASTVAVVLLSNAIVLQILVRPPSSPKSAGARTPRVDALRAHAALVRGHVYWVACVFYLVSAPFSRLGIGPVLVAVVGMVAMAGVIWICRNRQTERTERTLAALIGVLLGALWLACWGYVLAPDWFGQITQRIR